MQGRFEVSETGWHRFDTAAEAVTVTLSAPQVPAFLELTVTAQAPVYAKLAAGAYSVLIASGGCQVSRLNGMQVCLFFLRRVITSIASGQSPLTLWHNIRRALGRDVGFGANADGGHGAVAQRIGPATLALWRRHQQAPNPAPGTIRNGPLVRVDITGPGEDALRSLEQQTYANWTVSATAGHDAKLVLKLPGTAALLANTLERLVLHMQAHPGARVAYADVWLPDRRTFCFGFDPVLNSHADTLSDLVIMDSELAALDGSLNGIAAAGILRLSEPLAFFEAPFDSLTTGRRPSVPPPACMPSDTAISCIIPTRDRADLLEVVVDGLETSHGVGEIIIVDNGSIEPATHELFRRLFSRGIRVVTDGGDFNFSRLCNLGARHASGNLLAFINNDIVVRHPGWLVTMAKWARRDDVGAVGTRLLYGDESLQHGGVALGLSGHCGHLFRHWPKAAWQTVPSLIYASTRMAVTGAVLMVAATKFKAIGGFDEDHFPVTFNDVDLCLRLREQGWRTIYEPNGEAFHMEGLSRGEDQAPEKRDRRAKEIRAFVRRWQHILAADPWFSPALSRAHEDVRFL